MSESGPGRREVAHRLFAAEFDDSTLSYSESDEERAPNYVVTPTGVRANRLFVAGVLTAVERVNDETVRGRIADPTGAFVTYAGQYQPEVQTAIESMESPSFVALTGKARSFEPEDADVVYTSVRPESVASISAETRDHWIVAAARSTLQRVAIFDRALDSEYRGEALQTALEEAGVQPSLAAGIPRAIDHYGTDRAYLEAIRTLAVEALELVADERETVDPPGLEPDDPTPTTIGPLPEVDVDLEGGESAAADVGVASEAPDGVEAAPAQTASGDAIDETAEVEAGTDETTGREAGTDEIAEGEPEADGPEPIAAESPDQSDTIGSTARDESPGDTEPDEDPGSGDDLDVTDEMYELDEEERETIEAEFGTEFSTGTEVDDPGEADIDVPDPEEAADEDLSTFEDTIDTEPEASADVDIEEVQPDDEPDAPEVEDESDAPDVEDEPDVPGIEASEPAAESDAEVDESPTEDVDLEDAVVEVMERLDDGDGADRDRVVETITEEYGTEQAAVEAAIDDALMSGRCYEPGDDLLKPI